ncbi:MAG: serine hydrolase domain-containing protein [Deinococcota bacterium]
MIQFTQPRSLALVVTLVFMTAYGNSSSPEQDAATADLEQHLSALTTRADVPSANLRIESPKFEFTGASGTAFAEQDDPMTIDTPFRTASTTKMITATLVMKLAEDGELSIGDTMDDYFPAALTNRLHVYESRSYGANITIEQLLSHTSGLADYFFDGDANGNGTPDFLEIILTDTDKLWEPLELVNYTINTLPPLFAPGTSYHYSDTNYVLLGLIIEQVTDKPLHEAYREYIFEPLGMDDTYLEHREAARSGPPADTYIDDFNTSIKSLSSDWAGGGLVSTTDDLTRFIRAFADGKIVDTSTRDNMLTMRSNDLGEAYGLGVYKENTPLGRGYGHDGFHGSRMIYIPSRDLSIVMMVNQTNLDNAEVLGPVLEALEPIWISEATR